MVSSYCEPQLECDVDNFFGVGGRGRRPFESADPEGKRRVGQQATMLFFLGVESRREKRSRKKKHRGRGRGAEGDNR